MILNLIMLFTDGIYDVNHTPSNVSAADSNILETYCQLLALQEKSLQSATD